VGLVYNHRIRNLASER